MQRVAASVLGFGLLFSSAAFSEELMPLAGRSVHLGDVTGIAYYSVEKDGYQVVATFASGEAAQPIRFVATLTAGQKVIFSVPREAGQEALSVEITRTGDHLYVTKGQQVASLN
jgi:hypothetical protein